MAKNKYLENVKHVKHFLLGAGLALVITFTSSSVFALSFVSNPQNQLMPCLKLGGKTVTVAECNAADTGTGSTSSLPAPGSLSPTCEAGQVPGPGVDCLLGSPKTQQSTTSTQSDSDISDLKKMIEEMKLEKEKENEQEQKEMLEMLKKMTQQVTQPNQQSLFGKQQFEQQSEEEKPAVDKSKLSSAKNPTAALVKKGLKNVDKLLNTLSKKFNKQKTKTKKIAVVRSIAKDFMKLCTKYAPSVQDEEFSDEESFTCDEFVADLSEPIAAALKSKDADLAFELTFDALNVNFKEFFNSLIQ